MRSAVVICPGRGTYNKAELGYLQRHFPGESLLASFEDQRRAMGQSTLTELDGAERFVLSKHTRGDNASALIYAATLGDFMSINRDEVDVVAVTGNSMGWYSTLACAGALSPEAGFEVANTMGDLMQKSLIGGQLIYPFVDETWRPDAGKRADLLSLVDMINSQEGYQLHLSIDLGGMLVLAGDEAGLTAFEDAVEIVQERFPMRLKNHAAFHTSLQAPVAAKGRDQLSADLFCQPGIPMIDGRGAIWSPDACDLEALWRYTLDEQVTQTYDFTRAITVAAREFAPDLFIITGPGATLGGAVIQSLILANWRGLADKSEFKTLQSRATIIVSMGMSEQRSEVL